MDIRDQEARRRQLDALRRAFGPAIMSAFADKRVIEIMINSDGKVWIERAGDGMLLVGEISPIQTMGAIQAAAALINTVVTAENPILECELPNGGTEFGGARLEALIPPVVAQPSLAIRKKAELIFTLDDYVEKGILAAPGKTIIEDAVRGRKNILICGGTGTGKTTLANAVLEAIARLDADSRIVIIEDTLELQCAARNAVFLRTSDTVDQTRLLRATMRLRPDRIVVGEVRDRSALALLKAWNTGHPGGVGTVHANDARAALVRIGQLIQEANVPPAPELIAEAVDLVISIRRTPSGRIIDEIVSVDGFSAGEYQCKSLM
jgi:type IV secretion system protein VirB11